MTCNITEQCNPYFHHRTSDIQKTLAQNQVLGFGSLITMRLATLMLQNQQNEINQLKEEIKKLIKQLEERKSTNAGWRAYAELKEENAILSNQLELERSTCNKLPPNALCFFPDGDAICCVYGNFINLQESPAGFGKTKKVAELDLYRAEINLEKNK